MEPFLPAGELIGDKHRIRTVTISDDPNLPSGEYRFVDSYCTDKTCDCRKAILQVFYRDKHVSTLNFGWENEKFYTDWMGAGDDDKTAKEMSGLSTDWSSPNRVSSDGMLILVNHLLDAEWIAILKEHYRLMRDTL